MSNSNIKWQLLVRPEGAAERSADEYSPNYWPHFDSAQEALEYAKNASDAKTFIDTGFKIRPGIVIDYGYRDRELNRLYSGEYRHLPLDVMRLLADKLETHTLFMWDTWQVHLSTKQHGKVAYTANPEKGTLDIQTVASFGSFLTNVVSDHYQGLTSDDIRDAVTLFNIILENRERPLFITKSRDEAVAVYLNGPNSCMSKDLDEYEGGLHPASVYHGGDIDIAYIMGPMAPPTLLEPTLDDLKKYRVTARAVINQGTKAYGRIYGDSERLKRALEDAGYLPEGREGRPRLVGSRLPAIPCPSDPEVYIMPFLDFADCVEGPDEDGFFITTDSADGYSAQYTSGITAGGYWCACYGRNIPGERHYIEDIGEFYSDRAVEAGHAHYCDYYEAYFSGSVVFYEVRLAHETQSWSGRATEEHAFYSEYTNEYYSSYDFDRVEVNVGVRYGYNHTETWTGSEADSDAFQCAYDEGYYSLDHYDYVIIEGETVLEDHVDDYVEDNALVEPRITSQDGIPLIYVKDYGIIPVSAIAA